MGIFERARALKRSGTHRALFTSNMRVEGGKQAAPAQKAAPKAEGAGQNNLEAQMKDFPKQDSLIQVLRNPELRKKLEDKVGGELVAKLDKIFNARPEGIPPTDPQPQQPQAAAEAKTVNPLS